MVSRPSTYPVTASVKVRDALPAPQLRVEQPARAVTVNITGRYHKRSNRFPAWKIRGIFLIHLNFPGHQFNLNFSFCVYKVQTNHADFAGKYEKTVKSSVIKK